MILIKNVPDKWVRKAVVDALNGLTIDNIPIDVYDWRVTGADLPDDYIVINSQSNFKLYNKCEYLWENLTTIQVVSQYFLPGNPGSRLFADDVMNEAQKIISQGLVLDSGSDLKIVRQNLEFPADFSDTTTNQNIYIKSIALNLLIN